MIIRCCYGCEPPRRHSGCHSTCSEYAKERAEATSKKERYRKTAKADSDTIAYIARRCEEIRRKKRCR